MELAPHHQTWLSGPDTGQEPARAGTRLDHLLTPMMWFVATRLTVKTALGRKLRDHFLDPLVESPSGGCDERTLPRRHQTSAANDRCQERISPPRG